MSISTAPQQGPSQADVFQEMYFPIASSNVSCYIANLKSKPTTLFRTEEQNSAGVFM